MVIALISNILSIIYQVIIKQLLNEAEKQKDPTCLAS